MQKQRFIVDDIRANAAEAGCMLGAAGADADDFFEERRRTRPRHGALQRLRRFYRNDLECFRIGPVRNGTPV
jgi:hypothetical protein